LTGLADARRGALESVGANGALIPSIADEVATVRYTAFRRFAEVARCLLLAASVGMEQVYQMRPRPTVDRDECLELRRTIAFAAFCLVRRSLYE